MEQEHLKLKLHELFKKLAPEDWNLVFYTPILFNKNWMAYTGYAQKIVHFNKMTLRRGSWAICKEVLKHEIAHIRAGSRAKHGDIWQLEAHKLGCLVLAPVTESFDFDILRELDN